MAKKNSKEKERKINLIAALLLAVPLSGVLAILTPFANALVSSGTEPHAGAIIILYIALLFPIALILSHIVGKFLVLYLGVKKAYKALLWLLAIAVITIIAGNTLGYWLIGLQFGAKTDTMYHGPITGCILLVAVGLLPAWVTVVNRMSSQEETKKKSQRHKKNNNDNDDEEI